MNWKIQTTVFRGLFTEVLRGLAVFAICLLTLLILPGLAVLAIGLLTRLVEGISVLFVH